MLGGTWASKLTDPQIREKWEQSFRDMFQDSLMFSTKTDSGPDQTLLKKYDINN